MSNVCPDCEKLGLRKCATVMPQPLPQGDVGSSPAVSRGSAFVVGEPQGDVERVARAIADGQEGTDYYWQQYIHEAEDAISAMVNTALVGESEIEKELSDIEGLCSWGRTKSAIRFYAQIQCRVEKIRALLKGGAR